MDEITYLLRFTNQPSINSGDSEPHTDVWTQNSPPALGYALRSILRAAVVIKRRSISGPPKAQFVTCGAGISSTPSTVPSGANRVIRLPPQCAYQTNPLASTVSPSGLPSRSSTVAKILRPSMVPSRCLSNAYTIPPYVST